METRSDSHAPGLPLFQPLGSWEAAARWNQMAFEWMTTGWRQWLQLLTVWPATAPVRDAAMTAEAAIDDVKSSAVSAQAGTQAGRDARTTRPTTVGSRLRGNDGEQRATASGERRTSTAKRATAKSKRPAGKRGTRSGSRARG